MKSVDDPSSSASESDLYFADLGNRQAIAVAAQGPIVRSSSRAVIRLIEDQSQVEAHEMMSRGASVALLVLDLVQPCLSVMRTFELLLRLP